MKETRPDNSSKLEEKLSQKLASLGRLELVCFDVFDTVLTRVFAEPAAIFFTLGRKLHANGKISVSAEEFARARRQVEARVRHVTPLGIDIQLGQIYEEMGRCYSWASGIESVLEAAEIDEERAAIRPVPGAARAVAYARRFCRTIAFVSDMYLPAGFIKEQLLAHGLANADEDVFVSSECGCKKGNSGALLQHVLDQYAVNSTSALHVGNDWMVDCMAARRVGMNALYVPEGNNNRYEDHLTSRHWDTSALTTLYAGASRLARLKLQSDHELRDGLGPVATAVAAPLLLSYALWVVKKAADLGLRRLYFLAREGEAVFMVAKSLVATLNIPIELRYLYVSRQSLNLALLNDIDVSELQWALTGYEDTSVCKLLSRLGLRPEVVAEQLASIGMYEESWGTSVAPELWPRFLSVLTSDEVREKIFAQAETRKSLVELYLREEGFFDDVSIGLVDTTGVGSQFRTLDRIRVRSKLTSVEGFLMARMWQPRLDYTGFPRIHSYYIDQYTYRRHYSVPGLTTMLEIFCAAEHGTVTEYRVAGRRVEPVLVEADNHSTRCDYTRYIREAINCFATAVADRPDMLKEHVDTRNAVLETFSLFWNSPSDADVWAWGGYPVDAGVASGRRQTELAPRLGVGDLSRIQFEDPSASFLGTHVWLAGAERRSRQYVKLLISIARGMKRAARRIWQLCPNRITLLLSRKSARKLW